MAKQKPQLIVALDVDTMDEAKRLVDALAPVVDIFKIGSQLFTAAGPASVRYAQERGKKVFLDLKFHDIPNTVASAVASAVGMNGLFMLTVHTQGGEEMLRLAATAGAKKAAELGSKKPLIVGVTVLTSDAKRDNLEKVVLERAKLAKAAGLDGIVASVEEAAVIRRELGPEFVIVTPGIRSANDDKGDQKRVATPAEAIRQGSDFLVVGRPIVKAPDPLAAAQKILDEMRKA